MAQTKFVLDEKDLPSRWYNIQADLPAPLPPVIHPGTLQPIGPQDLAPAVPDGDHQAGGEPGALDRHPRAGARTSTGSGGPRRSTARIASRRRWALPARIYYKWEGVSPAGSHKPNTAVAQAYYNHQEGVTAHHHRDGRRAVGLARSSFALPALRDRVQGLHGARLLRPEAVPARS